MEERIVNEVEHGRFLAQHGAGEIWSVGGLNGQTSQFLAEVLHRPNACPSASPTPTPTATFTPTPTATATATSTPTPTPTPTPRPHKKPTPTPTPTATSTPTATPAPTPAPPTALGATNVTNSSFTAHWSSVSGAIGYRMDVSTKQSFSSYVPGYQNLDVGNPTSYPVTGLQANTSYYYRLRSYNSNGTSPNSNVVTVKTARH